MGLLPLLDGVSGLQDPRPRRGGTSTYSKFERGLEARVLPARGVAILDVIHARVQTTT